MKRVRVYDIPTRIFHLLFGLLFIFAFTIGNAVDDDNVVFSYHMLAGILMCFLVLFRLVWGVLGSKHARFTNFSLHPTELIRYLKGIIAGDKQQWAGHNPASSWAAIVMMFCALGLGATGYLMSVGQAGEDLEEIHELLANAFLLIVLLHITGLGLHSLRHRDSLWKSMFDGRKSGTSGMSAPVRSHALIAVLLLASTFGFSTYLSRNFDSNSRNLSLFGKRLHLGEADDHAHRYESRRHRGGSRREHHEDD